VNHFTPRAFFGERDDLFDGFICSKVLLPTEVLRGDLADVVLRGRRQFF